MRPQASIKPAVTAVTAFIGRALKGPVNQPIAIGSFNDYQRVFGGLWPGTREYLRASVDYDGIDEAETDRFNLVIQRIREPGSEFIEDQEIFRRVSIHSAAERGVAGVLTGSRLVRARGIIPRQRPDLTRAAAADGAPGYVLSNNDGDDGDELTNYDIIGDAKRGTGLFALQGAGTFNFLCVPPLASDVDIGLPALLVALRLCRQRQALLLIDPPQAWGNAGQAIEGLRNWPLYSEDAVMFFPRVLAFDRLRGRNEAFGPAAAAAGLLARLDRAGPVWREAEKAEEALLRPALRGAVSTTDLDHVRLSHAGVNLLQSARVAARALPPPRVRLRTLVAEAAARSDCLRR